MLITLITKEEMFKHSDVEEMGVVSSSWRRFHKPHSKPIFEDVEFSQVYVSFYLASLVQVEGKTFQDKRILCENTQTLIFGELHVARFLLLYFMEYEGGWVDYLLEPSHSFARI